MSTKPPVWRTDSHPEWNENGNGSWGDDWVLARELTGKHGVREEEPFQGCHVKIVKANTCWAQTGTNSEILLCWFPYLDSYLSWSGYPLDSYLRSHWNMSNKYTCQSLALVVFCLSNRFSSSQHCKIVCICCAGMHKGSRNREC